MIAKIIRLNTEKLNSSELEKVQSYSYNLPLFSIDLNSAYRKEFSEYVLQLWQISHGFRYPSWIPFINEDDMKKINAYWDWMIEQNLEIFEFLL